DLVAELRGGGDRGELCLALAAAKALDEAGRGNELDIVGDQLLEPPQGAHARVRVVVADATGEALGRAREQLAPGAHTLEAVRKLALGALDVAEVGDEEARLGPDYAQPARSGEPGDVAEVRRHPRVGVAGANKVPNEELVELVGRNELGEELGALDRDA